MALGEKKVWMGEMFSAASVRRMMIGTVESTDAQIQDGKVVLSYVMMMDLEIAPPSGRGQPPTNRWGMTPDPGLFSATPSEPVNSGMFLITKFLDPVEDKGLISQYQAMTQEIRTAKSGLVTPKSPIMPGR